MAKITSRSDIDAKMAQGKGASLPIHIANMTTGTAAAASSGYTGFNVGYAFPTTYFSSITGLPITQTPTNELFHVLTTIESNPTNSKGFRLARMYKVGTLDLTATGDKLTLDGAVTYPLTRTLMGTTTTLNLTPCIVVTTATSVTAPVIRMRTAAGGSGYVNQDGNAVIGTQTITFPSTATVAQSGFFLIPEVGDSACQQITAIEVTTASTTGAADVYLMETIMTSMTFPSATTVSSALEGGLRLVDIKPATPTAGTVTSYLGLITMANFSGQWTGQIRAVSNT